MKCWEGRRRSTGSSFSTRCKPVALYNESLAARFNEFIRRLHQMKVNAPAPQVSPEISHAVILEHDRLESFALSQGFPWIGRVTSAALAANNSGVGIRNPTGSGIIVVIQGWSIDTASLDLRVRPQSATGVVSTGTLFYRDSRLPTIGSGFGGGCPVLGLGLQNGSVVGNGPVWDRHIANTEHWNERGWFVLAPGFEVIWWNATQNAGIFGAFYGYARAVHPEELALV
jgi:hypothetical protein